ncbi:MAG: oligosaccharide flippase family protein [Vicinamibacterales bacterium]
MLNDEVSPDPGMIDRFRQWIANASRSEFSQNVAWFTALSGFERVLQLVQTVLISNALGITEYGVYGLIFGTIGYVASNAGFQMGLTATVFVAKYRETEKAKAAGVIAVVSRFAWLSALVIVAVALPFTAGLTEWLLGASRYQAAVMLGIVFVGVTIVSGIQDGVAQGFEMFVVMARIKIAVAAVVLASIYPVAREFGLSGVLFAILTGAVLKCLALERAIWRRRIETRIPKRGGEVSIRTLVADFALPSVVVSLLLGFVQWFGLLFMSKPAGGFDEVAIINTGTQWRGPVLLLTTALGGVAVPAFGRLAGAGNSRGSRRLRRILSLVNLSISSVTALVMVAGSGLILSLYGTGFAAGRMAFCLMVLSTIPSVVANVYLQELVGAARMWRQLWLHGPYVIALSISFFVLVPKYQALGYAASVLIGSVVLLAHVMTADAVAARRERAGAGA